LLFGGSVALGGCSSNDSSNSGGGGGGDEAVSVSATVETNFPAMALEGNDLLFEGEVANEGANTVTGLRLTSVTTSEQVAVQGVSFEGTGGDLLTLDTVTPVGADGNCYNGSQGATLSLQESCMIRYVAESDTNASIDGDIKVVITGGVDTTLSAAIKVDFVSEDTPGIANELPTLSLANTTNPTVSAGGTMSFLLNNSGNVQEDVNSAYIDLSGMPDDLLAVVDLESIAGGVWDAEKKRIMVKTLAYGQTQEVSFKYKSGTEAEAVINQYYDQLYSNTNSGFIVIGGGNALSSKPQLEVKVSGPISLSTGTLNIDEVGAGGQAPLVLDNTGAGDVTLNTVAPLPTGVTLAGNGLQPGEVIAAGENGTLLFEVDHDTPGGTHEIEITYTDADNNTYTLTIQLVVDNSSSLAVEQQTVVVFTPVEDGPSTTQDIDIENSGDFDITLPADITDAFQLQAVGAGASPSAAGLSLQDSSCAGQTIAPGQSCQIAIQASNASAQAGEFQLVSRGYENIAAGNLRTFELQQGQGAEIQTQPNQVPPAEVKAGEPVTYEATITNDTDDLTLMIIGVDLPATSGGNVDFEFAVAEPAAGGNCWNGVDDGATLQPGESCTFTYTMAGDAGASVNGDAKLQVENVDTGEENTIDTTEVVTDFEDEANLPATDTITTLDNQITFQPGGTTQITLTNDSDDRIQGLKVCFPADIAAEIDQASITGGSFDVATNCIVADNDILPDDNHTFEFDFEETAATVLQDNYNELIDNPTEQIVSLSSVGSQPSYPALSVEVTPVTISVSNVSFNAPGQVIIVSITNLTNHAFSNFNIGEDQKPLGVDADTTCDNTLPAESACTYTLTATQDANMDDKSGEVVFSYQDGQGNAFNNTLTVSVNGISVALPAGVDAPIIHRQLAGGEPTVQNVIIENTGNFNWQLPATLSAGFALVANSGEPNPGDNGLSIVTPIGGVESCAEVNGTLAPNQDCFIGIQSDDPNGQTGTYQLNALENSNVSAGMITTFTLQDSFEDLTESITSPLPAQINADLSANFIATITNTGEDDLEITDIDLPETGGDLLSAPAGAVGDNGLCWNADGDFATLAQGEGCELQLTAAGDVGDTIEGDLDIELNGGQAHVRLTTFDSEFVAESTLPQQMTVDNGAGGEVTFTPNQDINIEVTNDSDSVALNNVIIDLSNMPQAIIDEIDFTGINGTWVAEDKVILLDAIAPEASKTVDLGLSNDAEQALLDNYDDLLNNATTELLVIRSGNAQSVVPDITVNVTPIEGAPATLTLNNPATEVEYTITNLSSGSITYDSITTDSLPNEVSVTDNGCADDLPMQTLTPKDTANDSCTITLEVASTSTGGDGNISVNFSDESETEITLQPTVSVTNTTTASVSNNFTNGLLVSRATADQSPITTEVEINNTGNFDIQTLGASITNGMANGLSVVTAGINNPCTLAGVLAAGDSCNLGIQSTNDGATLQAYTLTITADNVDDTDKTFTLTDFSQALISSGDLTGGDAFDETEQTQTVTLDNTLPAAIDTITLDTIVLDADLTNGGLSIDGSSTCTVASQINGNNADCNLVLATDTTVPAQYSGDVTVTYTIDATGESYDLTIGVAVDVSLMIADGNSCTSTAGITYFLPQTGQTPTSPSIGLSVIQDAVGCGVPWAYNDGEPLEPITRFTEVTDGCDPGDFMIQDNLTGLMWVGDGDDYNGGASQTWNNALDAATSPNVVGDGNANNFSLCGHDDWRLPNYNELSSLINYGEDNDQADWLNNPNAVLGDGSAAFDNIASDYYLSSSTYAPWTINAWAVGMNNGDVNYGNKGNGNQVLPVRGQSVIDEAPAQVMQTGQTPTSPIAAPAGADGVACENGAAEEVGCGVPWAYNDSEVLTPTTRFELGTGGEADCIIDNLTGLMWPQDANDYNGGNTQSWNNALDAATDPNVVGDGNANNFILCGHNDWRMPNIVELKSLLNLGESSQADWLNNPNAVLNDGSAAFANIAADYYWSSSTYAPITGNAWAVTMSSGNYRDMGKKYSSRQVLPVRGPVGD
jgi:hypothetical protein